MKMIRFQVFDFNFNLRRYNEEIHKLRMLCRVCKMFIGRAFEQCVSKKCPKVGRCKF
jgi:hypothetical protein